LLLFVVSVIEAQKFNDRHAGLRDDRSQRAPLEIAAVHWHRHFSIWMGRMNEPSMAARSSRDHEARPPKRANDVASRERR
jgi:hypothetical protein